MNDSLFGKRKKIGDFEFNKEVADVFDDMVRRSTPFYDEIQRMLVEQALTFLQPGTSVYDLGCSTGTTLCLLAGQTVGTDSVSMTGYDNSPDMIAKAAEKIRRLGLSEKVTVKEGDIAEAPVDNASVVFLNYVLQFIRPLHRDGIIQKIFDGLVHGGALLLTEKVMPDDSVLNRTYIDYYYNYKRRGRYSELEISQKREALENVLVPYRVSENVELLKRNGFTIIDIFFKWYNFAGFIAIKR